MPVESIFFSPIRTHIANSELLSEVVKTVHEIDASGGQLIVLGNESELFRFHFRSHLKCDAVYTAANLNNKSKVLSLCGSTAANFHVLLFERFEGAENIRNYNTPTEKMLLGNDFVRKNKSGFCYIFKEQGQ